VKIREKLTANIDLKDAIFGGVSIYVSVLLLEFALIYGTDFVLRILGIVSSTGEFIGNSAIVPSDNYGFFVAAFIAVSFILFFVIVLFEENLFSSHEKGWADLLGVGLVWGGVFVVMDAMIQSFVAFVALSRGGSTYLSVSIQESLGSTFYIILVVIITFLPLSFFFLRKGKTKS